MPGEDAITVSGEPHSKKVDGQKMHGRLQSTAEVVRAVNKDRAHQQKGQQAVRGLSAVEPEEKGREQIVDADHGDEP